MFSSSQEAILRFGNGQVRLSGSNGAPVAFDSVPRDERSYILDSSIPWHSEEYMWGTGYVVTDAGTSHWNRPGEWTVRGQKESLVFSMPDAGMELRIERQGGEKLTERFEWRNLNSHALTISGLGIQTPFNDRYPSAIESLRTCVNTHIFVGGDWSWVLAEPMDGHGSRLGLRVTKGELNAYSIQSRNETTGSNIRGHILLQVTDHALNHEAFGGQPTFILEPGASYTLEWELGWYGSNEEFIAQTKAPAVFSRYCADVSGAIHLKTNRTVTVDSPLVSVISEPEGTRLEASRAGTYCVRLTDTNRGLRAHTEVLFHRSLRETINSRVRYILDHQVGRERGSANAGSIVSVDTRTGCRIFDPSWSDWSDGSERIGMPVLLLRSANMNVLEPDLVEEAYRAADEWQTFAERRLIDETGAVKRSSTQPRCAYGKRFYDVPWMVQFYTEQYRAKGREDDLAMVVRLLDRAEEIGSGHFLSIEFAETCATAARLLTAAGWADEAEGVRNQIVKSARYFLSLDMDLPDHEVPYEQSIIAPLISLLIEAYRITGDHSYLDGIRERLPWLIAFSGQEPDSRLYGVAIRHWDGYWFGLNRQFGDVFPHYWSCLSAEVLVRLPEIMKTEHTQRLARAIFEANMANYHNDGSATCAFLFPSNIDGRPGQYADPLANDQDWHLNIWLRMIDEEGFPED